MPWTEIYTYEDLNAITHSGIITESFHVNSTTVNRLKGVKEIRTGSMGSVYIKNLIDIGELEMTDCSFSFFGNLQSLNNLRYIGGDFRFGAPLKSLENLEEIEGDFRPQTNDLEDLGKLRKVGGTLDLRGMVNIQDLSNLKEVGENLNLVKTLKGSYDLNHIKIGGRIIYWNKEPQFYKHEFQYIKERKPPVWKNASLYEFENNLLIPNKNQKEFYEYFKSSFFNGTYVDVGGMRNYIRYFTYELLREYQSNLNFEYLVKNYKLLSTHYPYLAFDCHNIELEIGRKLKIKKYTKIILPHEEFQLQQNQLKRLIKNTPPSESILIDKKAEKDLFEILKIGFNKKAFTKFGLNNIKLVLQKTIDIIRENEIDIKKGYARCFFDAGKFYKTQSENSIFNANYYRIFFDSEKEFQKRLKEHNQSLEGVPKKNKLYPVYYPPIVLFSIEKQVAGLIREAENFVRQERNLPKVGEGWISETELYYKIKTTFSKYKVVHHGRPSWLGLQHFDIFFPKLNIAIEYQGKQHTEAVDFFGGEEGFKIVTENDRKKKEKCGKNNCILIEVYPDYEFKEVVQKIRIAIDLKKKT